MIINTAPLKMFIKADDVRTPKSAVILSIEEAVDSDFSDYFLNLKVGKEEMRLGLKESSGNLALLVTEFGKDTNRWKSKKISLSAAQYKGKDYVKISV